MPARQLPVRPDVQHVKHEARHLLRAFRAGNASALADFREFTAKDLDAPGAQLSDAQLVLARSYGATSFPQLIAAIEFIRACWSTDGNRVRDAVLAHAEILKDYYKTPHDGWRDDVSAAARQGNGAALKCMFEGAASIADMEKRQEHLRAWAPLLPILFKLGNPFHRPPTGTPTPGKRRSLAELQDDARTLAERADLQRTPEDEARRSWLEQHMKERAQDPTRIDRSFERMRAHDVQFRTQSLHSPELQRRMELMNECLRLYIESHPLP